MFTKLSFNEYLVSIFVSAKASTPQQSRAPKEALEENRFCRFFDCDLVSSK